MPQLNFPAPGSTNAVQHTISFGGFDIAPTQTYRYTNLLTWSEDLTNTTWTRVTGNTIYSSDYDNIGYYLYDNDPISSNGVTVFKNIDNSFNVTVTANNSSFGQRISVQPNTNYTFSFYSKQGTASNVFYRVYDNTTASNIVSATNYAGNINANTWSRINVSFTTGPGCFSTTLFLVDSIPYPDLGSVKIYWPQFETGLTATEYNPTQFISLAALGLTALSPGNVVSTSGGLTDYVDTTYDFPPVINILGINTITYNTANWYQNDYDLFQSNVTTSSTKILYIPEQAFPPFSTGESIRLTDSASGIVNIYTVASCTTGTVTILTDDFISEKLVILAKSSGSVYSQDKIINDYRNISFVGNISTPRSNYYKGTYFGIPYRSQVVLGSDHPNYSYIDIRPVDNNLTSPLLNSTATIKSIFSVKGFKDTDLSPGILNRDYLKLREINYTKDLGQYTSGQFKSAFTYIFKEPGTSRSLLPVSLNKDAIRVGETFTLKARNPLGVVNKASFIQDQEVFNVGLIKVARISLETKLRGDLSTLHIATPLRAPLKYSNFIGLDKRPLVASPRITLIFRGPDDRRQYFAPNRLIYKNVHHVRTQENLDTFAQLNRDRTRLINPDTSNLFDTVGQTSIRFRPEQILGLLSDYYLTLENFVEKRIVTNFHTLSIDSIRSNVLGMNSNVLTTLTANNISNVARFTTKSSYSSAERYLIDLFKPIYSRQLINTNINLNAVSLPTETVLTNRAFVIPTIRSNTIASGDSNFRVNLLQKPIFSLTSDSDQSLKKVSRLGRLAMANVAAIGNNVERTFFRPIPLRVPQRIASPINELFLARTNRAFIRYKFSPIDDNRLKPALFKTQIKTGFVADKLFLTGTITNFTNISPALNKWFVVNDEPLRTSYASLRKYINEGPVQPPMQVIGQSGNTNDLVSLYLDDNDILTLIGGNTSPTQSVTINPVIKLESPAVYFDGYQDFIESNPSAMLGFGTTPTTIEMMIRPMASSPLQIITSFWSNSNFLFSDKLDIYLSSQLQVCFGRVYPRSMDIFSPVTGAYEAQLFCRTEQSLNTSFLTHLAIVLQNNSVNVYFNGVQQTIVGQNLVAGPSGNAQFRIGYTGTFVPSFTFVSNI